MISKGAISLLGIAVHATRDRLWATFILFCHVAFDETFPHASHLLLPVSKLCHYRIPLMLLHFATSHDFDVIILHWYYALMRRWLFRAFLRDVTTMPLRRFRPSSISLTSSPTYFYFRIARRCWVSIDFGRKISLPLLYAFPRRFVWEIYITWLGYFLCREVIWLFIDFKLSRPHISFILVYGTRSSSRREYDWDVLVRLRFWDITRDILTLLGAASLPLGFALSRRHRSCTQ